MAQKLAEEATEVVIEAICGHGARSRRTLLRYQRCGNARHCEREWGHTLPLSYTGRVGVLIKNGFCQTLAVIEGVTEALAALRSPLYGVTP